MGDALTELLEGEHWVATADDVVPDVETDPDPRGVRRGDQAVDLGWRLDIRPGMRVEGQAATSRDRLVGEGVEGLCQLVPGSVAERGVPSLSARPAAASRSGDPSSATHRTSPSPSTRSRSRSRPMANASEPSPVGLAGSAA